MKKVFISIVMCMTSVLFSYAKDSGDNANKGFHVVRNATEVIFSAIQGDTNVVVASYLENNFPRVEVDEVNLANKKILVENEVDFVKLCQESAKDLISWTIDQRNDRALILFFNNGSELTRCNFIILPAASKSSNYNVSFDNKYSVASSFGKAPGYNKVYGLSEVKGNLSVLVEERDNQNFINVYDEKLNLLKSTAIGSGIPSVLSLINNPDNPEATYLALSVGHLIKIFRLNDDSSVTETSSINTLRYVDGSKGSYKYYYLSKIKIGYDIHNIFGLYFVVNSNKTDEHGFPYKKLYFAALNSPGWVFGE